MAIIVEPLKPHILIRGKAVSPHIKLDLFSSKSIVLDTAMGYGVDIAAVKKTFPDAEVHGIDSNIVMRDDVWEDNSWKGLEYSYGRARDVVKSALGSDILPSCNVKRGSALKLDFEKNRFNKILSIALLHHLCRDERKASFEEAYRVLKKNGLYIAASISCEILDKFSDMKGRYSRESIDEKLPDGARNKRYDRDKKDEFAEEVKKITRRCGLEPTPEDMGIITAAVSDDSWVVSELRSDIIRSDLRSVGYSKIYVNDYSNSRFRYHKLINIVAVK
ncbi:MAG: class I SAM-dependent methyltransferase [Candidatus Aenigmatarchaeota archaeon]